MTTTKQRDKKIYRAGQSIRPTKLVEFRGDFASYYAGGMKFEVVRTRRGWVVTGNYELVG